jgi:DNA-binding transcriptional ArsR family regulator
MDAEIRALAEDRAEICRVFANAKRVMILWSVANQEKSVTEIAEDIDASLQSTSQHLHLMKERRILESRREGQTIYYRAVENEMLNHCGLFCPEEREAAGRSRQYSAFGNL